MPYVSSLNYDKGDILTGSRLCVGCWERKPMTEFHWANGARYRRRRCKECVRVRQAAVRAANPAKYQEAARWRSIRRKYGLTKDRFDEMAAGQGGRCGICREPLNPATTHIDHDHKSGRVRGVLCFTCNTALGKFHDDPEVLEAAIRYLRAWRDACPEPTAPFVRSEAVA